MASQRRRSTKNIARNDEEDDKKIRAAARTVFASLFLGGWGEPSPSSSSSSDSDAARVEGTTTGTVPSYQGQEDDANHTKATGRNALTIKSPGSPKGKSEEPDAGSSLDGLGKQVAEQVRKLIPEDPQHLRQTSLYREAYKGIQWQRDNYLVGREYANWRIKERYRADHATRSIQSYLYEIQYDETALAHPQVANLAASFIPSDTVKNALLPLVLPVITYQLYPFSRQGLVHLIESQGDNLSHVLKGQILQFLSNPQNRAAIKKSTRGYISTSTSAYDGGMG